MSLLQPSPHPLAAPDAARRCGSWLQSPSAWLPCPRALARHVPGPGAGALGSFSRGAPLQKGSARAAQSWGGGRWSSAAGSFHSLQAKGLHAPRLLWSRDKSPSSEDAWKGGWRALSKANSPPPAPPRSPCRVQGSLLLPTPLSARITSSLGPFPPLRAPFSGDSCCGQVGQRGWGCSWQGLATPPKVPWQAAQRDSCPRELRGTGIAQGSPPGWGVGHVPRPRGRVGAAGASPPQTRNYQETGAAPRGAGWSGGRASSGPQ